MFLWEVLGEIVFTSLIAFNEMMTSHCDNLSTHHYHATYHPRFDTQFCHSETTQQHFCAVAISYRKKRKRSTLPFCTKEIGIKMTSKLFWQGLGLQEKGILANVLKDPQQLNGPESNLYRPESNLYRFLSYHSYPTVRIPKSLTCFLPWHTRSVSHLVLRRICPGYLQVCPLFRLFTFC